MALLDESLAISSELGMRPLMERVLSRREILKALVTGASRYIRRIFNAYSPRFTTILSGERDKTASAGSSATLPSMCGK